MRKQTLYLPLLALMLCLGVFLFPITAFAQTGEDITPPTLTATLADDKEPYPDGVSEDGLGHTLTVIAKDDGSGVDSIFIGKHRFSTLADGTARLPFKEYAGTSNKQVEIYATDVAGNRSQPVMIDNPYYVAPTAPVPAAATSTQVSAPAPVTRAPAPASAPSLSPASSSKPPAASITEEAIQDIPNALTPNGGGSVQDYATDKEGKEFFTVTTAAGTVYYLVIDRQRGTENVYFLSPVTEKDLLALAESDTITDPSPAQPEPQPSSSAPGEQPEAEPQPPVQSSGWSLGTLFFVLLAVAAMGAVAYYVKIVRPRRQAQGTEEYEDDWDEEDAGDEAYFFVDEEQPDAQPPKEE